MNNKMLKLLYRSFDDMLTSKQQQQLEEALLKSKELREEKEQIIAMRTTISDSATQSFKPFFAEKVMRRIRTLQKKQRSQETFFDSLFYVFKSMAIAATILLILLMSYNILKNNHLSLASAFAEPEVTLEQVFDPTLPLTLE